MDLQIQARTGQLLLTEYNTKLGKDHATNNNSTIRRCGQSWVQRFV